jgi:hypothetical protein
VLCGSLRRKEWKRKRRNDRVRVRKAKERKIWWEGLNRYRKKIQDY